mmetsp:Transcript_14038/g.40420  ORF Transcript_14038/g.40420 Transcript_14038/m.40420 type:complete len:219 (+) Transcript_14038:166-822(+)
MAPIARRVLSGSLTPFMLSRIAPTERRSPNFPWPKASCGASDVLIRYCATPTTTKLTNAPTFGAGTKKAPSGLKANHAMAKLMMPQMMPARMACVDTSKNKPRRKAGSTCNRMPFCMVSRAPKSSELMKLPQIVAMTVIAKEITVPHRTIAFCDAAGAKTPSKMSMERALDTPRITESAVDMIAAIDEQVSVDTRKYSNGPMRLSSLPIAENADTSGP